MVFGKKGTSSAAVRQRPDVPDGHRHVLELLDREEAANPHQRAQMGGTILLDLAMRTMNRDKGIHIESLIAALASCGGAACLQAAFDAARESGKSLEDCGFMVIETKDGGKFYYGDPPNFFLWENPASLLGLTLGAAQALGASVSAAMVEEVMGHVAKTVGTDQFGIPRKEKAANVPDLPVNWVKAFKDIFADALETYEVPLQQRPAAFGFALQKAIDAGKQAAPPMALAQIAVECALPMSKLDL